MYNKDAVVLEPAGALSISALEQYQEMIKGKMWFASLVEVIMTSPEWKKLKKEPCFTKA